MSVAFCAIALTEHNTMAATDSGDVTFKLVYFRFAIFFPLMRSPKSILPRHNVVQYPLTSTRALAKASGASCGRLWPMPPVIVRFAYLPENLLPKERGPGVGRHLPHLQG